MKYTVRDLQADFPDDDACLEWLVNYLYPNGITCKNCQRITKHYRDRGRKSYSCGRCAHHVHPMSGTIFHRSTTPLTSWFYAMQLLANTKSGVSAKTLQRQLGVTYKTAWRMMHQIRLLMTTEAIQLSGEVEADETFVHANTFKRSSARKRYGYDARRTGQVVFGIVERGGKVKVWHVRSSGARVLRPLIQDNIPLGTRIHTDGYLAYRPLNNMGYEHRWTDHSKGQFYTEDSYTQNIENVWSHLKRGIKGVYRNVSAQHLQKYCDEFAFRYSYRHHPSAFWVLMEQLSSEPLSLTG
jgi:transposase